MLCCFTKQTMKWLHNFIKIDISFYNQNRIHIERYWVLNTDASECGYCTAYWSVNSMFCKPWFSNTNLFDQEQIYHDASTNSPSNHVHSAKNCWNISSFVLVKTIFRVSTDVWITKIVQFRWPFDKLQQSIWFNTSYYSKK